LKFGQEVAEEQVILAVTAVLSLLGAPAETMLLKAFLLHPDANTLFVQEDHGLVQYLIFAMQVWDVVRM